MIVVVYLVILVGGFFFLVVRPQRRQLAARRALIASVGIGDEVVTSGGMYGFVVSLADDVVELEISPGVTIKVARGAIAGRVGGMDAIPGPPIHDDDTSDDTSGDDTSGGAG